MQRVLQSLQEYVISELEVQCRGFSILQSLQVDLIISELLSCAEDSVFCKVQPIDARSSPRCGFEALKRLWMPINSNVATLSPSWEEDIWGGW